MQKESGLSTFPPISGRLGYADIYLFRHQYFIVPILNMPNGVPIDIEPLQALPDSTNDEQLGEAVKSAIDVSRSGTAPKQIDKNRLLTLARVESWRSFQREAANCLVEINEDRFKVYPSLRRAGGFVNEGEVLELASAKSVTLGEVVRQCLLRS